MRTIIINESLIIISGGGRLTGARGGDMQQIDTL